MKRKRRYGFHQRILDLIREDGKWWIVNKRGEETQ